MEQKMDRINAEVFVTIVKLGSLRSSGPLKKNTPGSTSNFHPAKVPRKASDSYGMVMQTAVFLQPTEQKK